MYSGLSFEDWQRMSLLTETDAKKVITHLTHIEDLVITKFYPGAKEATNFVDGLAQYFSGHSNTPVNVNVKIDGAPSIVVGKDPADGKFFVGTKGALAKTPKIAKSVEDIQTLYAGKEGLIDTMTVAFQALSGLEWSQILQGDVVFTPAMKKIQDINHEPHITFKPNTIVYAVPLNSDFGKQIDRASFGIAFHTTYLGKSLNTVVASPQVDITRLHPDDDVIIISNKYRDMSGNISFTKQEMSQLDTLLRDVHRRTPKLRTNVFVQLLKELPLLQGEFMMFQNALVRQGKSITLSPKIFSKQFVLFLAGRQRELSAQKKTTQGMQAVSDRYKAIAKTVADHYEDVVELLGWQQAIIDVKGFLLEKLNAPTKLGTFYETDTGLVAGPHEGFVAMDRSGNFVKLVNRDYFSKINLTQGRFQK